MIPDARKLKRGLKDISSFFSDPQEPEPLDVFSQDAAPGIQFFSLLSQESVKRSRFLSRYLGAQLGTEACPCFVIHIDSSIREVSDQE